MKRIFFAALVLIAGTVGIASAQLTPAHSGHYYDPNQSGQGVELHVKENGYILATFFLGRVPGWSESPMWVSGQGIRDENNKITLYSSDFAVFGEERPLVVVPIGEATIWDRTPLCGTNCIVVKITIDGRGRAHFSPSPEPVDGFFYMQRLM